MRSVFELLFGLLDVLAIVVRGRPTGLAWQQRDPVVPDPGRIRRFLPSQPPRVFTIELYYAHLQGATAQEISESLGVTLEWVEERLAAARECVEFELPERKST